MKVDGVGFRVEAGVKTGAFVAEIGFELAHYI